MPRIIKPDDYSAKRNDILDAAQQLIYIQGYERMTIQHVLDQLQISKGAFYHYFDSKSAVLEALIERMQQEVEASLIPLVQDPNLSALDKLQRFFATLEHSSMARQSFVADLMRVWLSDENAIVREKVYDAMMERRVPLLTLIVHQGVEEGLFTTPYPDHAAEIILSLARGMGTRLVKLMLALAQKQEGSIIQQMVETYGAYADALERVLGAPSGSLQRPDAEALRTLAATLTNR
jgi:AcrR family transcriptional regulator